MAINKLKYSWWFTKYSSQDKDNLISAFDNNEFTYGENTRKFEKNFAKKIGSKYAVITNSGTSAIAMALIALDIKKGDEVILPALGWIATAQAILFVGAKPVFVDVMAESPIVQVKNIENKITNKTKAIIPVHYNGRVVNLIELIKLCKIRKIHLIEDACKAMFSKNKKLKINNFVGTYGDIGCFSFGMISLISSGYAGICVTNNYKLYTKLNTIRWHGVKYQNKEPHELLEYQSFNFKPSNLLIALANNQLKEVNKRIKYTIKLYDSYLNILKKYEKINIIPVDTKNGEVPILIDVISSSFLKYREKLKVGGIEICRFHRPMNEAKYIKNNTKYKNSEFFGLNAFHLPSGILRNDLDRKYFQKLEKILLKLDT